MIKKIKLKKPIVAKLKPESKKFLSYQEKLKKTIQSTFPEKINFTTKEKIARVEWRRHTLFLDLKAIESSSLSVLEKAQLKTHYKRWIKNYDNLLNNLKKEKK